MTTDPPKEDTTPTTPTHVPVAGMLVPVQLVPSIVAAMRGTYPLITDGLDDEAAVRAVLRWWVKSTLTEYEARKAESGVDDAVAETRQVYREKAQEARTRAEAAADLITDAPPAPEAPPAA